MFENVDGDRRSDAGVTGILLAHTRAFSSGELIRRTKYRKRKGSTNKISNI